MNLGAFAHGNDVDIERASILDYRRQSVWVNPIGMRMKMNYNRRLTVASLLFGWVAQLVRALHS